MKIKTSQWTLLAAVLFTINSIYWFLKYPDDYIGLILFSTSAVIFYISTLGNWKAGN